MTPYPASHYPGHPAPVSVPLLVFPDHDCSYLPGRRSRSRGFLAGPMPGEVYHGFMDAGFRRSGRLVYQPVCPGCRACLPLRVPVAAFQPSKSQRRCRRRNLDIEVRCGQPVPTFEKFELYKRYANLWHGKAASTLDGAESSDSSDSSDSGGTGSEWETFESFLYDSPVETLEFCYRDRAGRLLAVGICDVCPRSLSSVYFYHEPDASRRGLGTFGALHEIEMAREWGIPHYYLGYWISGCRTMEYKSNYRPCEVLDPDGVWRLLAEPGAVRGGKESESTK